MSIESVTERTYHVTATCDNCGVVRTWDQKDNPDADDPTLELGFDMLDPKRYDRGLLWFHEAACVHAYIEANVIEHLRHPEGVHA